jgi:hypothetical protein
MKSMSFVCTAVQLYTQWWWGYELHVLNRPSDWITNRLINFLVYQNPSIEIILCYFYLHWIWGSHNDADENPSCLWDPVLWTGTQVGTFQKSLQPPCSVKYHEDKSLPHYMWQKWLLRKLCCSILHAVFHKIYSTNSVLPKVHIHEHTKGCILFHKSICKL